MRIRKIVHSMDTRKLSYTRRALEPIIPGLSWSSFDWIRTNRTTTWAMNMMTHKTCFCHVYKFQHRVRVIKITFVLLTRLSRARLIISIVTLYRAISSTRKTHHSESQNLCQFGKSQFLSLICLSSDKGRKFVDR